MGAKYNLKPELIGTKVGIYIRLSNEDDTQGESNSVSNQRELLKEFVANQKDFELVNEYVDDGYSGTNFNRPGFKLMMEDIENKIINTVVVKDLSRLGRNYIEVGKYLEEVFPEKNIRFIAVQDNIDSFKDPDSTSSLMVSFKNLINDEYARDMSKKTISSLNAKKLDGKYMGSLVPFGYIKDPKDKHKLIIDKKSAQIVKLIFNMALSGKNSLEIADYLNTRDFLTPKQYKLKYGINKTKNENTIEKIKNTKWTQTQVSYILRNEVYTGTLVQNKLRKLSYKMKKIVRNPEEKIIRTYNAVEPLITKKNFDWI